MSQTPKSERLRHGSALPGLPTADWESLAVQRLAYVATVAIALSLVGYGLSFLRVENVGGLREGTVRPVLLLPLFTLLSALTLWAARSHRIEGQRKLDIGLVYLVVACAFAAIFRHALPYENSDVLRGIPPAAFAILFFAVVVPVRPRRLAVAATAAALSDPLALALAVQGGNPNPTPTLWLWLFSPLALALPLAIYTSRVLFTVNETLDTAREYGSYRLVEKLGQGGMGEVWRAEHRMLARPVAIKRISPTWLGLDVDPLVTRLTTERFAREARATAELESVHTIDVFDFGTDESGAFFYVMELLEGFDLKALVELTGPVPPARCIALLAQICDSLGEAHAKGMIHRDIKPANLFVCSRAGKWDFVKVLDFGLVKKVETGGNAPAAPGETEHGLVGSAGYIAPECMQGKPASAAGDIYAFGCVAYWLLTARPVFSGDSLDALIHAHCYETPEAPEAAADFPEGLGTLVLACLAKDPDLRPPGFDAIAEALDGLAVEYPWTNGEARAWWSDHRPSQEPGTGPGGGVARTRTWQADGDTAPTLHA